MTTIADLLDQHPQFQVPTQYRIAADMGRTTICFHNFYEQLFRGEDTPVTVHLCLFDSAGREIGHVAERVATGAVLQYDLGRTGVRESGLVGVVAVPEFDIKAKAAGKFRVKRSIGTGFYVLWEDTSGHVDTMHEWLAVRRAPIGPSGYSFVIDAGGGAIKRHGLIATNPCLGQDGTAELKIDICTADRRMLGSRTAAQLAPMGSALCFLDDLFPDIAGWLSANGPLVVRAFGKNLAEPFTLEVHRSGDFHIHHIN